MADTKAESQTVTAAKAGDASAFPAARLLGLDALRGLAILLMCLSGQLPRRLPNWMYHGYTPSWLPGPGMLVDGQAAADRAGEVALTWTAVENPWAFRGVEWPSFTWVDWVFPAFLFAMGAAIPLAYARRLEKGTRAWSLVGSAAWRFLVLVVFAVYVKQMSPWHQASAEGAAVGWAEYWTALIGVLLLIPVLARLPRGTSRGLGWMIRGLGVLGAMCFVAMVNDRPGSEAFSWNPSTGDADIIILLLAWCSLPAALLWLATRKGGWVGWTVRLFVGLGVALIAHDQGMRAEWRWLGERAGGWVDGLGSAMQSPKAWLDFRWLNDVLPGRLPAGLLDGSVLYDFTWFKFLWVVVPGTVVGDVLVRYSAERREAGGGAAWGLGRHLLVTAGLTGCVLAVFVGLKDYVGVFARVGGVELATPYAAILLGVPPLVVALLAMQGKAESGGAGGAHGRVLRRLTVFGTAWLTAGLVLAVLPDARVVSAAGGPWWARYGAGFFEGGIGKGPPARLSWYFTSLGLSVLVLVVLMQWLDVRGWRLGWGWLIANGQNPMLAYALLTGGGLAAVAGLPWLMPMVGAGASASLDGFVAAWIEDWYGAEASAWHAAGWALIKTLGLAAVVWWATRRGLVLRS